MLKKLLLYTTFLLPVTAIAQTTGSGSAGGLNYLTLTSPGGCTSANPCQIVTYLHYLGGEGQTQSDIQKYFNNNAFWSANPHTIVVAPLVNGSSASNNWGGVQDGVSPNMQAAVAAVKQIEASVPTMTNNVVVTGGSMGGIGTEAAMVEYGPKGTVQPGVFNSGLSYDGALYNSDQQAATTALCGVNFTMVHGASDQQVPFSVDQGLSGKLSGCSGFKFMPIAGAGHGTWNNPAWDGYGNGDALLNQTINAAQAGAGTPATANATTSPTTSTAAPTASQQVANTAQVSTPAPTNIGTITPGSVSLTDTDGHVWKISGSGSIQRDGEWVAGGGGTSQLAIIDGKVYGEDAHGRGWFKLSGDNQYWTSTPPPDGITNATTTATVTPQPAATAAAPTIAQTTCTGGTGSNATGKFYVSGGRFIGPNGLDFIGRGVNVGVWNKIDSALSVFSKGWSGINIVRIPVGSLSTPASALQPVIDTLTSHGIVALLEFHPWVDGSGPPAIIDAAAEAQWLASIVRNNVGNTFLWVASQNEPNGGDISGEHALIYKTVRAIDPNKIILLSLYGGGVPTTLGANGPLNPSTYTGMRGVGFDYHPYSWAFNFTTDQAAIETAISRNVALIQQLKTNDGDPPVMLAEYGNSRTDGVVDPGGMETVYAVINAGSRGKWGSAAWRWASGSPGLSLINPDNSPSDPYGQAVSLFIGKSQMPCTETENATNAQSAVAQIAQIASNDNTSLPTVASAQAAARKLAASR